jgi:hypothetical protein
LESGDVTKLIQAFARHMEADLRKRFERLAEARQFRPSDVEAGRAFVAAYVDFVHYAESLHKAIAAEGHTH